jgi:hypothetical protein
MSQSPQVDFFLAKLSDDLNSLCKDVHDIPSADKAFSTWSLMLIENATLDKALESYVDGGGDKGIDSIYIPDDKGAIKIVQTKRYKNTTRNLETGEIVKTLNGVRWLHIGDIFLSSVNATFRARAEEFRDTLLTNFPKVDIYFVTTGQKPAPEGEDEIRMFLNQMNSHGEEVYSVTVFDIEELQSLFRRSLQKRTPNKIDLDFSKPDPFEHDTGKIRAIVGSVAGKTIAELFDQYGNAIFESNVRNYLGNVRINKKIESTATDPDEAEKFWFYNNGISMVCSKLSYRSHTDSSRVQLEDAQIVNGCQSVHSLWHAYKAGKLQENLEILVRVVEQPDLEFVRLVTQYNNTQNPTRSADLVGRHPIQMRLQDEFEKEGYYYETRRGDWKQYFSSREDRIKQFGEEYQEKMINLKEAAQACGAFYLQKPVIAKNQTSILTTLKEENGLYEDVFAANISAKRVLGAVLLLRRITQKRKQILKTQKPAALAKYEDWLPHADFHIFALFARQYFDFVNMNTDEKIEKFFTAINQDFDKRFTFIVKTIGGFLRTRARETGYSHPRYFKTELSWQEIQSVMSNLIMGMPASSED